MTSLAPPLAASPPDPPTRPRTWVNGFHIATAALLAAYVAYVLIVVGRLTLGHPATAVVIQPLHSIILSASYTAITLLFIVAGRRHDRTEQERREAAWCKAMKERWDLEDAWRRDQEKTLGAWMGTVMETIAGFKDRPGRADSTVDLNRGVGRVVYQSVAAYGPTVDSLLETLRTQVDQKVDAAIGGVQEFGNQRWYAGYAAGREDTSGGSVVALQPRNGHRSSTP